MADEHAEVRAIWVPSGAAVFVGGFVVMIDWYFAAQTVPSSRHLPVWPLYLAVGFMVLGFLVIWAGMSESKWLWLPGKSARRKALQREYAEYLTAFFMGVPLQLADRGTSIPEVRELQGHLQRFVIDAWGIAQSGSFMYLEGIDDLDHLLLELSRRVTELGARCALIPVQRTFMLEPVPDWLTYCERLRPDILHVNF